MYTQFTLEEINMNKYLVKNGIDVVNTFERDYEVGVEVCKANKVSALDYFKFLENSKEISQSAIKHRMKDVFYFLILDQDIRGE